MIAETKPAPLVHWLSRKRDPILNRVSTRCGIEGWAASFGDIEAGGKVYRTAASLQYVTCPKCRPRIRRPTDEMLSMLRRIAATGSWARRDRAPRPGRGTWPDATFKGLINRGFVDDFGKITDAGRKAIADAVKPFKRRDKP